MKKRSATLFICLAAIAASIVSQAAITPYSEDFSSGDGGWTAVLGSPTLTWDKWYYDYDDGNPTQILPYSAGMETGDGVYKDGGLMMQPQNTTVKDEAMGYTLSGTLEKGEIITFSGNLYTGGSWWYAAYAQIWNVTDNRLLAETGSMTLKNPTAEVDYKSTDFSIQYMGTADDDGDTIQIRILENCASTGRKPIIDNVSVEVSPHAYEYYETFSSDNGGWSAVLGTPNLVWAKWWYDYDDGDPTQVLPYSAGMETGDGVYNDGGLMMEPQNATVEDEAMGYTLSRTLQTGETITFGGSLYTGGNWWYAGYAQIWNVTDNRLLASSSLMVLKNPTVEVDYKATDFSVEYATTASDAGDTVQIRILEFSAATSRRPIIDNAYVYFTESPIPTYSTWVAHYPSLGSYTNQTDDPDGDSVNNLYEYALGGNPTNSADAGLQSTWQNLGGTIEYVYHQFSDAAERGLVYELQVDDDLVAAPGWTNTGVTVTGTNVGAVVNDAGTFDVISNQVPMDVDAKFIRLKIEQQ